MYEILRNIGHMERALDDRIYLLVTSFPLHYPVFVLPAGHAGLYVAVAWLYYTALLFLTLLPLFFVVKKWKSLTWGKIVIGMASTFFFNFFLIGEIDRAIGIWLEHYVDNALYITQYDGTIVLVEAVASLLLSLSPLLFIWLIYRKYTWKRFAAAFAAVLLTLGFNLLFWYWSLTIGFQLLIERFN